MMKALKDYSEISSIQGLVYIFMAHQSLLGRLFWTSVVVGMTGLGIYWSVQAYAEWEESPVLTTLSTPAMYISDLEFPGGHLSLVVASDLF